MSARRTTSRQRRASARRRLQAERRWLRAALRTLERVPESSPWVQLGPPVRVNLAGRCHRLGPKPPPWVSVCWVEWTGAGWVPVKVAA